MHDIKSELATQIENPPDGDRRIAAYYSALITEPSNSVWIQSIEELLERRSGVSPSYAVNLLLKSIQKQLMDLFPESYPSNFDSAEVWQEAMGRLQRDETRMAEFRNDIITRQVQSNISERYKVFKLVIKLLNNRFQGSPNILDVGCSRNHGLKKLAYGLPFNQIRLASPVGIQGCAPAKVQTELNQLISEPLNISYGIGTDITPLDLPGQAEWARSCSFYPSELLNKSGISEYDFLDHNDSPLVTFELGNFVTEGIISPFGYENNFDVITVSTFMYQLSEEQRNETRKLLRKYARTSGVIIYQDFLLASGTENKLNFQRNWFDTPYSYRTFIEYADDPSHRLFEIFRWKNGRCNDLILGRDFYTVTKYCDFV